MLAARNRAEASCVRAFLINADGRTFSPAGGPVDILTALGQADTLRAEGFSKIVLIDAENGRALNIDWLWPPPADSESHRHAV